MSKESILKEKIIKNARKLFSKDFKEITKDEYWQSSEKNRDISFHISDKQIYFRPIRKQCVKEVKDE